MVVSTPAFALVYGCVLVTTSVVRQTPGGVGPGTRDTYSWLDDTDNNFGPNLPLLFKMHEILSKIVAIRCDILGLKCIKFDFD